MLKVLAVTTALVTTAAPAAMAQVPAPDGSYAAQQSCSHTHRSKVAYRLTTNILRNHSPLSTREKLRVAHLRICQTSRAKAHAVHRHVRRLRAWRMSYAHVWPIRLNALPASWIQWAKMITFRESRWNQHACDYVNCTHYSYFQWALSTWYDAGGTGHPYNASWPHQAVLAIRYARSGHISAWAL